MVVGYHHLRKHPNMAGNSSVFFSLVGSMTIMGGQGSSMGGLGWNGWRPMGLWPTGEIPQIAGAQNPPLKLS